MNKKEALDFKLEEGLHTHENGVSYSIYKTKFIEEDKEVFKECKLFHSLAGRRLDGETHFEYKVRRYHIKRYQKSRKRLIWFSKNDSTLSEHQIAKMSLSLKKHLEKNEEDIAKAEEIVDSRRKIAIQTNLGTYDRKKIEKFIEEQENKN